MIVSGVIKIFLWIFLVEIIIVSAVLVSYNFFQYLKGIVPYP